MAFLTEFLLWFGALLQHYGPVSVLVGAFIEEVIVPIPSPVVPMTAGFALVAANASLAEAFWQIIYFVMIPASIGAALGTFFTYAIGYYGGERVVRKFHKFLGMEWSEVEKYQKRFTNTRKTWLLVILLRAVPIIPTSIVSVAIGFMKLSWKKFGIATFIGYLPRAFIFGFLGWYFGNTYLALVKSFEYFENIILVLLALGVVAFFYWHRKRRQNSLSGKLQRLVKK